jgi:hypothetical protein
LFVPQPEAPVLTASRSRSHAVWPERAGDVGVGVVDKKHLGRACLHDRQCPPERLRCRLDGVDLRGEYDIVETLAELRTCAE